MRALDTNPAGVCSSCFNAKPGMVHVDFEASWDGPVFRDALPNGEPVTLAVQIDDLILCAECVAEAATLVPDARDPIIARYRAQAKINDSRIDELKQQVQTLKAALAAEPKSRQRKKVPA